MRSGSAHAPRESCAAGPRLAACAAALAVQRRTVTRRMDESEWTMRRPMIMQLASGSRLRAWPLTRSLNLVRSSESGARSPLLLRPRNRSASTVMIFSPWKRPFSMKIEPVCFPAIAPPAMNRFGTLVSNVSRVQLRLVRLRIAADAGTAHQVDVGMVAGQQEHAVGRDLFAPAVAARRPRSSGVISTTRVSKRAGDRSFLDAVLDVGTHPVLDRVAKRRVAVHQRDVRAAAEQLERRFGRRVLAADDDDALAGSTGARRRSSARRAAGLRPGTPR